MRKYFFVLTIFIVENLFSQQTDSLFQLKDSLHEIVVQAFVSNKNWKDIPVSVALMTQKQIQNISTTSFLPAINAVAGVRMEERSPGSYRLSVRGSTLRSPFGIRNVKVYWNDIPLTDAGGNTYLNLIDVNNITTAEIIKGPSASLYGAGTGGVLLLKSDADFLSKSSNTFSASVNAGTFNILNEQISWYHTQKKFSSHLQQAHVQSDGYREQSALRKDVLKWDAGIRSGKHLFDLLFFYTDLYYQTPGGLTKLQMLQNPQQARPSSGSIPGAVQQQAAIYNQTIFGGIHHQFEINKKFSTESSFQLNHTSFVNPAIAVYEKRDETNSGIRTQLIYHQQIAVVDVQWVNGAEWLYNHARIDDYANHNGSADTLQLKDDLYTNQWFAFSQIQIAFNRWSFNAGASINQQSLHFKRLTDANTDYINTYNPKMVAPRVAVLYKWNHTVSLYALAAKGFSPPSLAEVHPQDRIFHSELQPEYGWNIETGVKGNLFKNRLQFDLALYDFELKDAIVIRNNAQGSQYFVNAGSIAEKGVELWMKFRVLHQSKTFISSLNVWGSYTYQPYFFSNYVQGTNNYSGNAVTGVAKNNLVMGIDLETHQNMYCHIQLTQTSSLPVDDANSEFADAFHLLQIKLGKHFNSSKMDTHVFAGADNLLNELYSLGNDMNAAAKRFYNPAAGRNIYVGMSIKF